MSRYDIHIQLIDPTEQGPGMNFTFGNVPVIAVRGPQKLANRWIMQFLRSKGSDPVDSTQGTYFPALVGGGNLVNLGDLEATIIDYIEDCNAQIMAIDQSSPWLDPDERLQSAQIVMFNQTASDTFEVWIQINTVSGDTVKILIPYAQVSS